MANESIRIYTEGDTTPNLVRTVPVSTGFTVLTGATVRLRMKRPDGTTLVKTITEALTAQGQIDAPTATPPGFFFIWLATDLQSGDTQRTEIEYDDGAGAIATEKDIFFDVGDALG